MEDILKKYKAMLDDEVVQIKTRIRSSGKVEEELERIRDELARWGKEHLSKLFLELKGLVEKNNPEFIEKNPEKWETMLDKAEALTEYGLYVAPVDLLKGEDAASKAIYVGAGALVGSLVLTKVLTGKVRLFPSFVVSLASGGASYYLLNIGKEDEIKNTVVGYIDDAKEWIETAFENMYKIFKDAAA